MAVIMKLIPKCDVCKAEWLPDKRLPDLSPNPAFDNPRLCKRCGKCKTPRWNENERKAELKKQIAAEVHRQGHGKPVPGPKKKNRTNSALLLSVKDEPSQRACKHRLLHCPVCTQV